MISFNEEAKDVFALALFEPEECHRLLEPIKVAHGWEDAAVRVQGQAEMGDAVARDVRAASVLPLALSPAICGQVEMRMATIVKPLIAQVWGVDLPEYAGMQLVRYTPGGHYETHQDAALDFEDRYFTLLCYLNDDFEGGRTWFPHLNHRALPERGKAIVFPAKYFHRAEPVINGEKYVLVGWVMGPIPIKWI
jgi:predicted 2-oxoglutarate/Fe(II)-dependent dioxygenase YbiX